MPHDKKGHFLKKLDEYATKDTKYGKPKNADLVNSIADIRKALLVDSFWQDNTDLIPMDEPEWCEIWLSSDEEEVLLRFQALLKKLEFEAKEGVVRFPERTVKVVKVNRHQLERLNALSDDIAEYRRAKETAVFWTEMPIKSKRNG